MMSAVGFSVYSVMLKLKKFPILEQFGFWIFTLGIQNLYSFEVTVELNAPHPKLFLDNFIEGLL